MLHTLHEQYDTKALDTQEVQRARHLAAALAVQGNVRRVVYNSAASAPKDQTVYRIQQKHAVEHVFRTEQYKHIFSFTALQANLFMEELWKCEGLYETGHFERQVSLFGTSQSTHLPHFGTDMGRLAGTILLQQSSTSSRTNNDQSVVASEIINVASDVLTPTEMADAFGMAQQGSPRVVHDPSRFFALVARLFLKDLYEVICFYRTSTATTDIAALQNQFPEAPLTSFAGFFGGDAVGKCQTVLRGLDDRPSIKR
jgi:hypothetical protein